MSNDSTETAVDAAVEAVQHGYQPVPVTAGKKAPTIPEWNKIRWDENNLDEVREKFEKWASEGVTNLGILLGAPSSNLVDVDIDNDCAMRLKDYFLPPTAMRTGRDSRPSSHHWYVIEPGTLSGNRMHKMADRSVSVELRASKVQTVIPPSTHPDGEKYVWDGEPWGGDSGPALVNGRLLALQVAMLGMTAVLLDEWPAQGGRHDAYLALAGGLLRYGEGGVHPYWERNLPKVIQILADVTNDRDGGESRVAEVMKTTVEKLREGDQMVAGFGKLSEILGYDTVSQFKTMVRDVESAAGVADGKSEASEEADRTKADEPEIDTSYLSEDDEEDPLAARTTSWDPVNLDPYILGKIATPEPEVLTRDDGSPLLYPGRVNMLYGSSESAKSWIAQFMCIQEMEKGNRAMYLDFEDEPENTLSRMFLMGASPDEMKVQFTYIRPEDPLAPMQQNRWGSKVDTAKGRENDESLEATLKAADPSIIVADGMTVLFGLHGLDSNDATSTDVITNWLKRLTRNGRSTVVIIDHAPKNSGKGALPLGSQHKKSMVQGTMIQAHVAKRPMPGARGEVELYVMKDRPGRVREHSLEVEDNVQMCGTAVIDSTVEGRAEMTIQSPVERTVEETPEIALERSREAAKAEANMVWEERVKTVYGGEEGKTLSIPEITSALENFSGAGDRLIRATVNRLVHQGWLEPTGKTKGRKYTLTIGDAGYAE